MCISVTSDYKYYAFISYKHRDGEHFVADSRWAKRLKTELGMMHLSTPPIERDSIIDEHDDTISQVFRDDDNLSGGELTEAIRKALKESKMLVIILSKEMVADQNKKEAEHKDAVAQLDEQLKSGAITKEEYEELFNKTPRAWLLEEYELFMELHGDNMDNVCLVNVEGEPISPDNTEMIPNYLLKRLNDNKRIVSPFQNFNDPQFGKQIVWGKDEGYYIERTAAAIAGQIFGLDPEEFWSYRQKQKQAERFKMLTVAALALLVVSSLAFLLILSGSRRREEQAIRFMDRAQTMIQKGDRQKAMILARSAYEKSPRSSVIKDFMRQFQTESGTKPFSLLRYQCFVNPARNEVVYYDSQDNKSLYVLNGKDFSTRLVFRDIDFLNSLYFSPDGEKMLIAGADSIKIYDFVNDTFCKGIPYKGEFGDEMGTDFAFYGNCLIRVWRDSCVVNNLQSGKKSILCGQGFDRAFVKDGLINCVRVSEDTLSVFCFDSARLSFTPVKRYPLSSGFKHLYNGDFEISPTSGNMAAVTNSGTIDYFEEDGMHHVLNYSEGFSKLKFNHDGNCLMAVKTDAVGNKWVHVWRNSQFAKEIYYSSDKSIQSIMWGNGEDIVAISREQLIISRLGDSYEYELDKRVNSQYYDLIPERQYVVATDDALYYLSDSYDNQKAEYIGLLKYPYPNWQGFGNTSSPSSFEAEFWKRFPQYSTHHHDNYFDSSNKLVFMADSSGIDVISVEQGKVVRLSYPSASASENWSNESFYPSQDGKKLYCLRRLFVPNDISSMAGDTEIMCIDMEKLSIVASTKMHDMVFLFGIALEGKLMMSDEISLYVLDGDTLQQLVKIDIEGTQIDKLIHIDDHRYLLPTTGKDLYELDLKDYSVSPSHFPFRSNSWRSAAFDSKYLQVKTNYSYGRMIYDVRNKKAVYFPDEMESIQDISNGDITINYHSVNHDYFHSRTYVRPILSDEQILMLVDSLIGKRTLSETDLWELNY